MEQRQEVELMRVHKLIADQKQKMKAQQMKDQRQVALRQEAAQRMKIHSQGVNHQMAEQRQVVAHRITAMNQDK